MIKLRYLYIKPCYMRTITVSIVGILLNLLFTNVAFTQIPQEKCIDFEELPYNVNFTESLDPGDVLLEEDGVIITAEDLYGNFGTSMVINSPNCRPSVYNQRHLVMDHAIQLDFTKLDKQPNLVIFSVGVCDGLQFIRVNNGLVIGISSGATLNQEVSLGVNVLYQNGNFIIEGPVHQLYYGSFETGIDLICFEFPAEDCDLRDLVIEPYECTDSTYVVDLDFQHSFEPQDSFCILQSDTSYGPFAYDSLPVTLGPLERNCDTIAEFLIRDKADTTCSLLGDAGIPCCEICVLSDLQVEFIECVSEELIKIAINFNHQNVGSDFFNLYGNNNQLIGRFEYASLPLTIGNYPVRSGDFQFLRVCDAEKRDCCTEIEFPTPECPELCDIREMVYEKTDCENDSFSLVIDFDIVNPKSDSFMITGNGRLEGPFSYRSLPLWLGPYAADCETAYKYIIRDAEDPECNAVIELGKVCCEEECEISELEAEVLGCNSDSTYTVSINFRHRGTNKSGFDIYTRDGFWGYVRNEPPFNLIEFPKSGSRFDLIKVCANDKPDCCRAIEIMSPDCRNTSVISTTSPEIHLSSYWSGDDLVIKPEGEHEKVYTIHLLNLSGISTAYIENITIPLSGYRWKLPYHPAGIYFVMIQNEDSSITKKVFKGN